MHIQESPAAQRKRLYVCFFADGPKWDNFVLTLAMPAGPEHTAGKCRGRGPRAGFMDAISIEDNGEASGMEDALEKVIARYPWLVDTDFLEDEPDPPLRPSGRKMHSRKNGGKVADDAGLYVRFPALRGRVRVPR